MELVNVVETKSGTKRVRFDVKVHYDPRDYPDPDPDPVSKRSRLDGDLLAATAAAAAAEAAVAAAEAAVAAAEAALHEHEQTYSVEPVDGVLNIGRNTDAYQENHIPVPHRDVSRHQLGLVFENDKCVLERFGLCWTWIKTETPTGDAVVTKLQRASTLDLAHGSTITVWFAQLDAPFMSFMVQQHNITDVVFY
jgi:hypothetical protein